MSAHRDEGKSSREEEEGGVEGVSRSTATSLQSGVATYESASGGGNGNTGEVSGEGVQSGDHRRSEVDGASHPLAVPEYPNGNASTSSEPLRSIRLAELTRRNEREGLDQDAIARAAMAPQGGMQATAAQVQPSMQASLGGARANNNEALAVRRHLFRAAWKGFNRLTRGRKWIFILKLLISLAQVRNSEGPLLLAMEAKVLTEYIKGGGWHCHLGATLFARRLVLHSRDL